MAIVIAMVMVIGTGGGAGCRWTRRCSARNGGLKLDRGKTIEDSTADKTLLRGERPSTVRSTEVDALPKPQRRIVRRRLTGLPTATPI